MRTGRDWAVRGGYGGARPVLSSSRVSSSSRVHASSYARSRPVDETLLARAPESVPPRAECIMQPDRRCLTSPHDVTSHWLKV